MHIDNKICKLLSQKEIYLLYRLSLFKAGKMAVRGQPSDTGVPNSASEIKDCREVPVGCVPGSVPVTVWR